MRRWIGGGLFFVLTGVWLGMISLKPVVVAALDWTPSPTPYVLVVPQGNVLFRDDFATYSQRWREEASPKARVGYDALAFTIQVSVPGVRAWSVPDFDVSLYAYTALVDVTIEAGAADAQWGFVLDWIDDDHFYALVLALDGTWQVWRYREGVWDDLTPPDSVPLVATPITPGDTLALHMRVESDRARLWVNDDIERAGEFLPDRAWSGGRFGLIAAAGRGFIDVSFDNVIVWAYSGGERPDVEMP